MRAGRRADAQGARSPVQETPRGVEDRPEVHLCIAARRVMEALSFFQI